LGGGVCFFECDDPGCKLQEREVVLLLLAPADQDAAVSVEPGVTGLYHPTTWSPVGRAQLEGDLFAPTSDVGGHAVVFGDLMSVVAVERFVEAKAVGRLSGRRGTFDRNRVQRGAKEL
jgi:hypothetical protein